MQGSVKVDCCVLIAGCWGYLLELEPRCQRKHPALAPSNQHSASVPDIRILPRPARPAVPPEARQVVGGRVPLTGEPVNVRTAPRIVRHVFSQIGTPPVGRDRSPRGLLA